MLGEGWDAGAIDRAWKRFGMPMGPFRLIDEIGIDVMSHAGDSMAQAFGERMAPAPALVALAISGRLGRKGGEGFYRYEGGREKGFDRTVYSDMKQPGARTSPDEARVRDRLVFAMVNEAARVLEERVVASAADVDLAMVMGTGFPPFRGGPLKYADDRGPAEVLRTLEVLEATCGHRFAPSPLIRELGESDETFHGAFPAGGK